MLMVKAGQAGRRLHRAAHPPPGAGRHHHRRRQHPLPRHHPPDQVPRRQGAALHRHRRLRRRRGRPQRPVASCPAATRRPGRSSSRSSRPSPPRPPTATPCCDWVGERRRRPLRQDGPQRHRVRRHAAHLRGLPPHEDAPGLSRGAEMHEVFAEWNKGELDSYLIEITRDILGFKDDGQASRWSTRSSTPPARRARASGPCISRARPGRPAHPDRRGRLRPLPLGHQGRARRGRRRSSRARQARSSRATRQAFVEDIRQALYASKIVSYAQGYMLHARGGQGVQVEPELRRHRPDVARRLHHPQRLPRQDQGGLRHRTRS